MNYDKRSFK